MGHYNFIPIEREQTFFYPQPVNYRKKHKRGVLDTKNHVEESLVSKYLWFILVL